MIEDTCDAGQRFVKGALRVPRSHVSPEPLARAPRSRFATVHRVPHLLRSSCFLEPTGSLALYTKDVIILHLYSCFMLDKFWRNLSALIRFFCTKLFTNVNGKAAREILADLKKKVNILNFISVFFSVLSGVSTFTYFTKMFWALHFTL